MNTIVDYNYELLGIEYHRMQLLRLFERFCLDMKKASFSSKVRHFYRVTPDSISTTKSLFLSEYDSKLDDSDATQMTAWIFAHLKKKPTRKALTNDLKIKLYNIQKGKCNICGCALGNDYSNIHVDHIIPWVLVGDELENNYQDLCKDCNLRKNKQIDYYYKKLVKLV